MTDVAVTYRKKTELLKVHIGRPRDDGRHPWSVSLMGVFSLHSSSATRAAAEADIQGFIENVRIRGDAANALH